MTWSPEGNEVLINKAVGVYADVKKKYIYIWIFFKIDLKSRCKDLKWIFCQRTMN